MKCNSCSKNIKSENCFYEYIIDENLSYYKDDKTYDDFYYKDETNNCLCQLCFKKKFAPTNTVKKYDVYISKSKILTIKNHILLKKCGVCKNTKSRYFMAENYKIYNDCDINNDTNLVSIEKGIFKRGKKFVCEDCVAKEYDHHKYLPKQCKCAYKILFDKINLVTYIKFIIDVLYAECETCNNYPCYVSLYNGKKLDEISYYDENKKRYIVSKDDCELCNGEPQYDWNPKGDDYYNIKLLGTNQCF
jgi:hypothetical protein